MALRPTAVSPNLPILLLLQTWETVIHERHPHIRGAGGGQGLGAGQVHIALPCTVAPPTAPCDKIVSNTTST